MLFSLGWIIYIFFIAFMHNNIFLKRADYLHCRNLVGFLVILRM